MWVSFGSDENVLELDGTVNVLNVTEFYTLKWLILCCANFTLAITTTKEYQGNSVGHRNKMALEQQDVHVKLKTKQKP